MVKSIISIAILLTTFLSAWGQGVNEGMEAPHFLVLSENNEFNLVDTQVKANIAGPVADVSLIQEYQNHGSEPVEAIYVFPASTTAAVYDMEMHIGDRIIKAEVKEKQQAQQEYANAKKEGKLTSLLEQHNPNVFQMKVANILPGDLVRVKMKYNELLTPEKGRYQFVFPTAVGPRYTDGKDTPKVFSNPYSSESHVSNHTFHLRANINSPVAIKEVVSPSHPVEVEYENNQTSRIILSPSEKFGGNRDFILEYVLAENEIASGTMLYKHHDENFFLSIVEPPAQVSRAKVLPREYVFIVDVSGSMNGFPLSITKTLIQDLLDGVQEDDYFNIVLFASSSKAYAPSSVPANKENIQEGIEFVMNTNGGGGTQLLNAVQRAMSLPKASVNHSRSFVIITDGYVHVERETFNFIEDNLGASNFFAFGIGSSVNRYLIEGIANMGRAESFIVTNPTYAKDEAAKFKKYIEAPLLTDIHVKFQGMEVYHTTPKYIPDLMAERPIYVFGKYKGKASGKMIISGNQGGQRYDHQVDFSSLESDAENVAIRYLWARDKIKHLGDYYEIDKEGNEKKEITAIGLKYNLLTAFTSFLAVDHTPRRDMAAGELKTVHQKSPLPMGMTPSNAMAASHGMGFEMSADVEMEVGTKVQEELLFVHILECAEFKAEIKNYIQEKLIQTDREFKQLLEGNTLTFFNNNGVLVVNDTLRMLSREQLGKLKNYLGEILQMIPTNDFIKLQLFWI